MKTGYSYLYEKIKQLPPELGEVVLNFDFTHAFDSLVNKYKLHYDQSEIVQNLTFQMMFNEINPIDFTQKLVSGCELAPGTSKELTDDINITIISPIKELLMKRVEEEAELYEDDEEADESTPSPHEFHPKSAYNEPITNDAPKIHHVAPIPETNLTHADVLHGIENPHPSVGGNSPVKTATGTKSYADIMGGNTTVKPTYAEVPKQPVIVVKPIPAPIAPTPAPEPKVDLIAMKGSAVVVSAPNKIETLPIKAPEILPTDPYKESL